MAMQDVFIGRQAVFDRKKNVTSYELLFRDATGQIADDDDYMTSKVLVSALMDIGLESISDGKQVHINASTSFLLGGMIEILPADKVSIEILETVPVTEEVIEACQALKAKGYHMMLDDVVYAPHLKPLVELADVIKVEFPLVEDLAEDVKNLKSFNVKLLAEKVETYEEYKLCHDLGFDYFQGYFFCKPEVIREKTMPDSKVIILRALQKVITTDDVRDLQNIIKQDVSLSYRLLKYINSVAFALRKEVESIEQALVLLGLRNVQRWLLLLSLSTLGKEKPSELIRTALYRGCFLESFAKALGEDEVGDDFLLGMFSILDALLDLPMNKAIESMVLPERVRRALLYDDASMSYKLQLARNLEMGRWSEIEWGEDKFGQLSTPDVLKLHTAAMHWADQHMKAL